MGCVLLVSRVIYRYNFIKCNRYTIVMTSSRSSALREIMKIEDKIKEIRKTKRYKTILANIRVLKHTYGTAVIDVDNPSDMSKKVSIRKNGKKANSFLEQYEQMIGEYDSQMEEWREKKKQLKTNLFGF